MILTHFPARPVVAFIAIIAVHLSACTPSTPPPPITQPTGLEVDPLILAVLQEVAKNAADNPANPDVRGRLAMAYEANELFVPARAAYLNAAKLDANQPLWPYRAAVCALRSGSTEEALAELEAVTQAHVGFAPAWHRLATVRLSQGDVDGARAAADRCLLVDPTAYPAMVTRAEIHLRANETAEAIALLEQVTRNDTSDRQARFFLGRAYQQSGRNDATVEVLLEEGAGASAKHVQDPREADLTALKSGLAIEMDRGIALIQARRPQDAIPRLERILLHHSDNTGVMSNLAIAHRDAGNHQRAIDLLDKALELQPKNFRLRLSHAQVLISAGEAVSKDDPNAAAAFFERARTSAKQAVEGAPEEWRTYFALGRAAARAGDRLEARDALVNARKLDPTNVDINGWLFETCFQMGDYRTALIGVRSLATANPTSLRPWVNMVHVNIRLKDFAAARAALAKAQAIDPNHERVVNAEQKLRDAEAAQ